MVAKLQGIDWSKTSIGFHHYGGTQRFGETGIRCLRQKYPLIMTETSYWISPFSFLRDALSLYERLGISWFSLDGKGRSADHLENEIIPGLNDDGYYWRVEN